MKDNNSEPILRVDNLHVHFKTEDGIIKAVN
ncbi:MAG: Oligopeptide/dipeptide ABC transporter, ATPase subunit, partial [Petrotoga mobilis]